MGGGHNGVDLAETSKVFAMQGDFLDGREQVNSLVCLVLSALTDLNMVGAAWIDGGFSMKCISFPDVALTPCIR